MNSEIKPGIYNNCRQTKKTDFYFVIIVFVMIMIYSST